MAKTVQPNPKINGKLPAPKQTKQAKRPGHMLSDRDKGRLKKEALQSLKRAPLYS